jgi:hypothetical protein
VRRVLLGGGRAGSVTYACRLRPATPSFPSATLLNGSGAGTLQSEPPAAAPQGAAKRRPGWPSGKKRGPRKTAIAGTDTEAPANSKLAARRKRENDLRRAKRAAARQGKGGNGGAGGNGKPGNGSAGAEALWKHAEALQPKTPWRAIAREFGTNEAQALDCYRSRCLPPGVVASAIERFLDRRRRDMPRRSRTKSRSGK